MAGQGEEGQWGLALSPGPWRRGALCARSSRGPLLLASHISGIVFGVAARWSPHFPRSPPVPLSDHGTALLQAFQEVPSLSSVSTPVHSRSKSGHGPCSPPNPTALHELPWSWGSGHMDLAGLETPSFLGAFTFAGPSAWPGFIPASPDLIQCLSSLTPCHFPAPCLASS